jgi:hypothetical protein
MDRVKYLLGLHYNLSKITIDRYFDDQSTKVCEIIFNGITPRACSTPEEAVARYEYFFGKASASLCRDMIRLKDARTVMHQRDNICEDDITEAVRLMGRGFLYIERNRDQIIWTIANSSGSMDGTIRELDFAIMRHYFEKEWISIRTEYLAALGAPIITQQAPVVGPIIISAPAVIAAPVVIHVAAPVVAQATAPADNAESPDDDDACVVCMMNAIDTVAVPCGHLKYCGECAGAIKSRNNICAVCRAPVAMWVKTYK